MCLFQNNMRFMKFCAAGKNFQLHVFSMERIRTLSPSVRVSPGAEVGMLGDELNQVIIIAADALIPCVCRTSALFLTM